MNQNHRWDYIPGGGTSPDEATRTPSVLCFNLSREEARQALWLLNRALNTLEPNDWPPLAKPYLAALEEFLK